MLDFLHLHALWLIMDPWFPHPWPRDRQRWPNIDDHNQLTIDAIVDYLPNLKHVIVSVAPAYQVHPALQYLYNTKNRLDLLLQKINALGVTDLVYVGFHWGICMLNKPDGAANLQSHTSLKLYAYPPLCSIMPGSKHTQLSAKMSRYVTIL